MTYQDLARREDLLDIIGDVSPDNNPLATLLGNKTASGTYHEWLIDHISRPTSVTNSIEGATATFSDLDQPTRVGNVCAIITQTVKVSGTEQKVAVAGMGDPYNYQKGKALKTWKNNWEYILVNGTKASGSSGVARQMDGIDTVVSTLYTARNSGTSLSETEFNDMVKDSYTQGGADNVFDLVLVPFALKQKISTFTAGATKYVDATDKRLTRPVMVYESDGGVHRIMAHLDVRSAAATPGPTFLGIKEDQFKQAWLRKPVYEELAKTGDFVSGEYVGEGTLEYHTERTSVKRTGYNQNG